MRNCSILSTACIVASSAAVYFGTANQAVAQTQSALQANVTCDSEYVVVSGDTLSDIAQRAYGSGLQFPLIYSANTAKIGPNPGLIEIGMVLTIPCLETTIASTADSSVIRDEQTSEILPLPDQNTVRILTAGGWEPYLDEEQEQGGMFAEIVNVAMSRVDGSPKYQIDFVNDWGAHLQPLLADHAYDLGFVWFRPNCAVVERLSEASQFRCNNLAWSEPIYEQIMGYFTLNDGFKATKHTDLLGKTICRPAGHSLFMMEEHGLVEPAVTIIRPPHPTDCIPQLLDGTAEVAVVTPDVVAAAIEEADAVDKLTLHEDLNQVLTLNAVISKTHPRRDKYLEMLDSGLKKIKDSGEWFEIVRRHLSEARSG